MRYRLLLIPLLALLVSACTGLQPLSAPANAPAEEIPADAWPTDPAVRIGVLENGLTYYIRYNDEPANRADLWLAINAGSLQEDEDQLGLAHFLEHMLFNGTERFPEMGVVDYLESIGMEFGPDVNARTSFDETVYTIQVPTDDPEALEMAFDVLEDWAGYATLDPQAIDDERGIIVEEWRLRQETADGRIREETLPILLGESHYLDRLPIGDMDVVNSAPPEAFQRFYDQWYRPDLMAVIAVGDFADLDVVEKMIQEGFSALPEPDSAQTRIDHNLPQHADTTYGMISDPEKTSTNIQIIRKRAAEPTQNDSDFRASLTRDIFYTILNERLDDIGRQPDAPFLSAGSGSGGFVRPVEVDVIQATVEDEKIIVGLDSILTELERAHRHGFTDPELARAQENVLQFFEGYYQERDNIESDEYADEYLDNFLEGEAIPSIEVVWESAQELIPTISLDEVNQVADVLLDTDNRVILVTAPEKEEIALPSEDDLASVVDGVMAKEIEPLEEKLIDSELMAQIPEPVAIVSENELPEIDVTEIELENGIRVLMKQTDFKDDEIVFTGFSLGGSSLVPDADFPEANSIVSIVNRSGVADFTLTDLEKVLTGKDLAVSPYIRELTEGLEGNSSVEDLETLFQLIHLYATAPRLDEDAFDVYKNQQIVELTNRALSPNAALQDTLTDLLYGESIRRGVLNVEEVESLDLERSFEIYRDRFADMGDFTFIFVGNFDEDELKEYARTYLGTLPATDREESWQDVAPDYAEGVIEENVYMGEGDQSIVQIVFTGPLEASLENEITVEALEKILDIIIREELREKRGAVYASGASAFSSELPDATYLAAIFFGTDPAQVDELVQASFDQVADLQANGPSEENMEKIRAQLKSQLEESLESNVFWREALKEDIIFPSSTIEETIAQAEIIDALSAEKVQQAAQDLLSDERFIRIALLPAAETAND